MQLAKRKTAILAMALTLNVSCDGAVEKAMEGEMVAEIHPEIWPGLRSPIAVDSQLEQRIDELISGMSLEAKVGQVIQAEINSITPEEITKYRIGSVLNGGGGWPGEEKQSTPEDWQAMADGFWEASMDVPEGEPAIPIIWGLDAVHGHNNVIGATLFPHNIGLGAANNPDLIREIGRVTAREVAATGQDWDFGPTIAVARDDRWGRTYESYSEDPEIVAAYAASMVEGLQGEVGTEDFLGDEQLIATAKHYLGDGGTDKGDDQGDNLATEEELRDIHGAGYVTALDAGVQTVMASFSTWHGTRMHGFRELLTDVLKGRMGFDGFVVGDWNAHGQVPGCSNDNCPDAFNAGIDMFMVPQDWKGLYKNTLKQVESGEISQGRLDEAVRRILRVKMRAGLFERGKPSSRPLARQTEIIGSPEHREVSRRAVRESLVLLKNNGGVLPLAPGSRVLVAGDGADNITKQSGGWTITWQGTGNSNEEFPAASSIWDGIRSVVESAGGVATLSPKGRFEERPDLAIVVFGEDPYAEFQGDRDTIDYSPGSDRDLNLLNKLQGEEIPVVSVFLTGRPLWVNPELNASDAFVVAWLPGTEGVGVADVLFADESGEVRHDFKGRLSFSWPRSVEQVVLNRGDENYDPLFAFGHGLTYAAGGDVAEQSEKKAGMKAASRTVYFHGGPVAPWKLYLGVAEDPAIAASAGRVTSPGELALTIRGVDHHRQEDARAVEWPGGIKGRVYLKSEEPVDISRESNGNMVLAFDVLIDTPPSGAVNLGMGCGEDCRAEVDLTATLAGLTAGVWQPLLVPLRCFADAGADMSRIDTPFSIWTDGQLAIRFSDVRLATVAEEGIVCP